MKEQKETKDERLYKRHPIKIIFVSGIIIAIFGAIIGEIIHTKYQEFQERHQKANMMFYNDDENNHSTDKFNDEIQQIYYNNTTKLLDGTAVENMGDRVTLSYRKYDDTNGHIILGRDVYSEKGEPIYSDWKYDSIDITGSDYIFLNILVINDNSDENMVAKDTSVYFDIPEEVGKTAIIHGCLSASNSDPKERWDEIKIYADREFSLEYVKGSAYMHNFYYGFNREKYDPMQNIGDIITVFPGAYVGYMYPDGIVRGGEKYQVNVSIKLNILWE